MLAKADQSKLLFDKISVPSAKNWASPSRLSNCEVDNSMLNVGSV